MQMILRPVSYLNLHMPVSISYANIVNSTDIAHIWDNFD